MILLLIPMITVISRLYALITTISLLSNTMYMGYETYPTRSEFELVEFLRYNPRVEGFLLCQEIRQVLLKEVHLRFVIRHLKINKN